MGISGATIKSKRLLIDRPAMPSSVPSPRSPAPSRNFPRAEGNWMPRLWVFLSSRPSRDAPPSVSCPPVQWNLISKMVYSSLDRYGPLDSIPNSGESIINVAPDFCFLYTEYTSTLYTCFPCWYHEGKLRQCDSKNVKWWCNVCT